MNEQGTCQPAGHDHYPAIVDGSCPLFVLLKSRELLLRRIVVQLLRWKRVVNLQFDLRYAAERRRLLCRMIGKSGPKFEDHYPLPPPGNLIHSCLENPLHREWHVKKIFDDEEAFSRVDCCDDTSLSRRRFQMRHLAQRTMHG